MGGAGRSRSAPLLIVITGPSGVGKDTIRERLEELGLPYHFPLTATSRPQRPGERDGVDYHFVSETRFQEMVAGGELLEHAVVYGYRYGVPREPVRAALARGEDVVIRTDVQGARYIKSVYPNTLTIFLAPPTFEDLERRLRSRASDKPEQLELRLKIARAEMETAGEFDYTVVNDDLGRCAAEIQRIIAAEKEKPREPVEL
ncbi:MAG: guanylate kinase [Chloroflexi bacterium]|nr:guanylate kinase [Chloroflexota bacterium]